MSTGMWFGLGFNSVLCIFNAWLGGKVSKALLEIREHRAYFNRLARVSRAWPISGEYFSWVLDDGMMQGYVSKVCYPTEELAGLAAYYVWRDYFRHVPGYKIFVSKFVVMQEVQGNESHAMGPDSHGVADAASPAAARTAGDATDVPVMSNGGGALAAGGSGVVGAVEDPGRGQHTLI